LQVTSKGDIDKAITNYLDNLNIQSANKQQPPEEGTGFLSIFSLFSLVTLSQAQYCATVVGLLVALGKEDRVTIGHAIHKAWVKHSLRFLQGGVLPVTGDFKLDARIGTLSFYMENISKVQFVLLEDVVLLHFVTRTQNAAASDCCADDQVSHSCAVNQNM